MLLLAPFALTPLLSYSAADHLGVRLGRDVAQSATDLRPDAPPPVMPLTGDLGIGDEAAIALHYYQPGTERGAWASDSDGERGKSPSPRAPGGRASGLLIRSSVILRAAQSGVQPTGTPVAPRGLRPAGLALGGVSGFGSGLRDGDVLTKVAGARATSEGAVIAAVTRAVEAGVPAITGEVWRRDQRITVTAEIPVVDSIEEGSRRKRKRTANSSKPDGKKATARPGSNPQPKPPPPNQPARRPRPAP